MNWCGDMVKQLVGHQVIQWFRNLTMWVRLELLFSWPLASDCLSGDSLRLCARSSLLPLSRRPLPLLPVCIQQLLQ